MAFPETNISDGPNLLWVRKDWMEKLGLSAPETIDDVKHIALTFAEENPANQEKGNIGLAVSTTLYGGTGISSEYGMNLILPHLMHIREDGWRMRKECRFMVPFSPM